MVPFGEILSIGEITFTGREIDVISCISNGLSVKDIGIFLNISPNTVSSHIRNIMKKTGTSSQSGILRFLELSNQHIVVHNRYIDLIVLREFEKLLKKTAELSSDYKKACLIHAADKNLCGDIYQHLQLAGIRTDITEHADFARVEFSREYFHIICTTLDISSVDSPDKNIVVLSRSDDKSILYGASDTIDDYYFAVLYCVEQICNSKKIGDLIDSFKKYCAGKKNANYVAPQYNVLEKIVRKKFFVFLIILSCFATLILYETVRRISSGNERSIVSNIQIMNEDFFLPRKNIAAKIENAFKNQSRRVKFAVLIGRGGAGKSTFVRNYLYKHDFDFKWEINAETETSISDAFSSLSVALADTKELQEKLAYIRAIPDFKIRNRQMVSFIFSGLKTFSDWALFFDSLEDFGVVQPFIPFDSKLCGKGKVFITTRNDNFKNISFLPHSALINIKNLDKNESIELFCNILGLDPKAFYRIEKIEDLLKDIPALPLDISAAAYYIKNTGTTLDKYAEVFFGNSEIEKVESKFIEESSGYKKNRYRIIVSIFDTLIQINSDFKKLLLFLCLMDSQNIPGNYFEKYNDSATIQEFVHHLRRFSMISEKDDMFSIHRSIQKIGLNYLVKLLSESEKEKFLNKIISEMTPYNKMAWDFYKENPQEKVSTIEKNMMILHLQSLAQKIPFLSIKEKKQREYSIKLSLTLLYCYYYSKSRKFLREFAEQIIKLNDDENVLEDIPLAILLEICGNKCTFFDEYKKAENYFLRCIAICDKTKNTDYIRAVCFSDFAKLLSSEGNFNDAKRYLDEAMKLVQKLKKPWQLQLKKSVFMKYCRCYNDHYAVYPGKLQYIINIAIDMLKSFNANELFYRSGKYNGNHEISIFFIRRALSGLYNRIGKYDKAYECEKESKFFLKRIQAKGILLTNHEVDLEICEGSTLLRMNRLSEAYDKLIKYVALKKEMKEDNFMYNVSIFISEILIRQNRPEEAYQYDKNALKMIENCSNNNDKKLSRSICCYHLALIEFRNKNFQQTLHYLSQFLNLTDDICKTIIEKEKYDDLKSKAAFDFSNDTGKIEHYFKNAAKILTAVYGDSHPFVIDFVNQYGTVGR